MQQVVNGVQGDSASREKERKSRQKEKGSQQAGTEIYYILHLQIEGEQIHKHIIHG